MPTHCEIRFDNPSGVYYAGQELSGTAFLTTDHDKTIRGIRILITGYAKVRWRDDRRNSMHRRRTGIFASYEQYLTYARYVLGEIYGSEFILARGNYEYPFQYTLPGQLPTSFNGLFGHIRYEVVLMIERPYLYDNIFKQAFTVIGPLDLNTEPNYRLPAEEAEQRTFFCCCCRSGPLDVRLSVPQSGYAPGQKIVFKLSLNNNSNVDILYIYVGFRKEITYESENPSRRQKRTLESIAKKDFGRLLRFSDRSYRDYVLLPPLPPTTLDSTKMIRFKYYLYAYIYTSGFHNNIKVVIPVIIGTVPLINLTPQTPVAILEQPVFISRAPLFSSISVETDIPPSYESVLPPTYEEAVSKIQYSEPDDERHKSGPFVPKYPVFYNCDEASNNSEADEE